jgi:hypothetical protein
MFLIRIFGKCLKFRISRFQRIITPVLHFVPRTHSNWWEKRTRHFITFFCPASRYCLRSVLNTTNLCCSFSGRHPYETTGKIRILLILTVRLSDRKASVHLDITGRVPWILGDQGKHRTCQNMAISGPNSNWEPPRQLRYFRHNCSVIK